MNKVKTFVNKLKQKLLAAIKRYPLAVVLFLAAAVMIMIVIEINSASGDIKLDEEVFIRLALSLVFSGLLSLTVKSACERFDVGKAIELGINSFIPIAGALIFFFVIPDFDSAVPAIRYSLLCALTASLFFFIPFIKAEKSASYFAQKVFLRLAVTMIYYGIITGGVEAILFAIENLLSVNMPSEIYSHTAVALAGLFIPSFFFAGIPEKHEAQSDYSKLIKILLHYIGYILLAAYSLVLYIYFIKILIAFTLPSNQLGNLVIYYSLISVAVLYFGYYTKDENNWTKLFHKFYPYVLIIPTLMMIVSFWVRINQYGFTEPRYYAILCAIFVLRSISIIKLQKKVRLIPLALAILMLVSIYGPLSSFNVSKWSQNRRFEKLLIQENMLEDGKIVKKPDASEDAKVEITQVVSYFSSNHETTDLKYVDKKFITSEMEDVFGFEPVYSSSRTSTEYYHLESDLGDEILEVKGYDYIVELSTKVDDIVISGDGYTIKKSDNADNDGDNYLTFSINDEQVYQKDMSEWLMPLLKEHSHEEGEIYSITDETDELKIKIILLYANYYENDSNLNYRVKVLFSLK